MSLKPYKIAFLDGSGRQITESEFRRFSKRDDFELVDFNALRQIAPKVSYFGEKLLNAMKHGFSGFDPMGRAEGNGLIARDVTSDLELASQATKAAPAVEAGNACWLEF